mgnify:CR=1 FL=1
MKKVLLLLVAGSLLSGVAAYAAIARTSTVAKERTAR